MSDAAAPTGDERTVSSTYSYWDNSAGNVGRTGQLKSITDEADNVVEYDYYANTGRSKTETKTATVNDNPNNPQTIETTYTYDDNTGRLKTVVGGQYPVEYGYDPAYGQMNSLKTWQDDGVAANFVETTWEYDVAVADQIDIVGHSQIKTV